ncbi:MAG: HAMP domain-containing histidine kinase [Bryobacteraceae bacterium]|nr:HAMP domain-containing sensor histidine kinase [Bryobacterales bacterium]NUN01465.1 HAMP domain-containing histidine kinase [Bryobacteraceae bacterium]
MRQRLCNLKTWLLASSAEQDPRFLLDVQRGSLLSLRVVGWLEIVVPLLMLMAGLSVVPVPITGITGALPNLLFTLLGAATIAARWTPAGRAHPRFVTGASIWLSMVIMVWSVSVVPVRVEWLEHHLLGYLILVKFGAAAAVPFRPVHMLALGLSIDTLYLVSSLTGNRFESPGLGYRPFEHLFTLLVTMLCTALTASVYGQRYSGYLAHQQALRTSEQLRETEGKLLISESAATMGRLAAALSHELNSPIGVLASAVDTLAQVTRKMTFATSGARDRLLAISGDAAESGRASVERLRRIVGRMQRFTNLDRAEIQSGDVNELLADVATLVSVNLPENIAVVTALNPLPRVICRPQQLSAVFSNLVTNAIDALPDGGEIRIATRESGGQIEIRICDNGRGIPAEQLASLFDPAAFHVSQGRVTAGYWSLFSCRQIIREHGGDIELVSAAPTGTEVRVTLQSQGATPVSRLSTFSSE